MTSITLRNEFSLRNFRKNEKMKKKKSVSEVKHEVIAQSAGYAEMSEMWAMLLMLQKMYEEQRRLC